MSSASIFVCVKWVSTRLDVDLLDATIHGEPHDAWFSHSDLAAIEVALRTADQWRAAGESVEVTVLCVGPPSAEPTLREFSALGVDRIVRVDLGASDSPLAQPSSADVAELLAAQIESSLPALSHGSPSDPEFAAPLVVCGDASADRGSGSVPAFIAHHLGYSQALGLVDITSSEPGLVSATRRLDGGRRELLSVEGPAVVSVEGSVAQLRRATLSHTLKARTFPIEVRHDDRSSQPELAALRPWRPPSRVISAPGGKALDRIVELTGAKTDRNPPRTVRLEPEEAARAILDQLSDWGYEWGTDSKS